jgi:glycosyltransferase involved in cell wall biosynthesis
MKSKLSPKVTVLMSVYNGEEHLREAIDSILNQTYKNFEFLIIDDGSTDGSVNIIRSYLDPRIRLIKNKKNIGITRSLNKGLKLARGEYIARMDDDDIAFPERLEKQVRFLNEHVNVGLVGGSDITINGVGDEIRFRKKLKAH